MVGAQSNIETWELEAISFLALSSIQGVGYWTLYKVASEGMKFRDLLGAQTRERFVDILQGFGGKPARAISGDWDKKKSELLTAGIKLYNDLRSRGIEIIFAAQLGFPEKLLSIPNRPYWLFYQGNLKALYRPSVAVVGTRKPTSDGIFIARYLVMLMRKLGIPTVSGLAEGIDQRVHYLSLRFNVPTIAVLGTGILLDYPAGSEVLREKICMNGGLIITEYLPKQSYSKENFVRRNRIQSALSTVVCPVQWALKSGTAHTVRYASEQNRQLMCLRMPDWTDQSHPEVAYGREHGAAVFTVPDDHEKLMKYLLDMLRSQPKQNTQLSLWDEY